MTLKLGWVESWDDETRTFLITFGNEPPAIQAWDETDGTPFVLSTPRAKVKREVRVRPGQQWFKFRVLKRYGPHVSCAD